MLEIWVPFSAQLGFKFRGTKQAGHEFNIYIYIYIYRGLIQFDCSMMITLSHQTKILTVLLFWCRLALIQGPLLDELTTTYMSLMLSPPFTGHYCIRYKTMD